MQIVNNLRHRVAVLVVSMFVMMMLAVPAFAQDANPFADANSDLLTYGKYGLIAGGVILGIMVGVRAGKALYKTLSS
jgi:hypothetical protein